MASTSTSQSHPIPPLMAKTMAAATGATMTALTMTPFDVIKTRLQTQPPDLLRPATSAVASSSKSAACCQPNNVPCVRQYSTLALGGARVDFRSNNAPSVVCLWDKQGVLRSERVTGFWDAGLKVWQAEGVRGLWKGVGTTLVIAVPSQTVYMVTYDTLRKNLPIHSHYAYVTPLLSGILARTIVSSISSPVELLRTRLQSTPLDPGVPHTLKSVTSGIRNMIRQQGVRSLYKGLGPTLWRDVPFSGLYWAGFETMKSRLRARGHEGTTATFISGATSGTAAAFITSPFDVLKTRRQALLDAVAGSGKPITSTIPLIKQIVRTEGVRALYAGLTPRMAKIAPACGIMISCYEGVERYFDIRTID